MLVLPPAEITKPQGNAPVVQFDLSTKEGATGFVDALITNYIKEASYIARLQVAGEKAPEPNRAKLADAKKEFTRLVAEYAGYKEDHPQIKRAFLLANSMINTYRQYLTVLNKGGVSKEAILNTSDDSLVRELRMIYIENNKTAEQKRNIVIPVLNRLGFTPDGTKRKKVFDSLEAMYQASSESDEHSRVLGTVIYEKEKARKRAGGVQHSRTVTGKDSRNAGRGLALNPLAAAMRKPY